jgi:hypothetical protein
VRLWELVLYWRPTNNQTGVTDMATYKIIIESNLNVVALKNYTTKYVDVQAANEFDAVESLQKIYGPAFVVSLVSIM